MDRWVTPPQRVTSPTWDPPLHVNRPLACVAGAIVFARVFRIFTRFLEFGGFRCRLFPFLRGSVPFLTVDVTTNNNSLFNDQII